MMEAKLFKSVIISKMSPYVQLQSMISMYSLWLGLHWAVFVLDVISANILTLGLSWHVKIRAWQEPSSPALYTVTCKYCQKCRYALQENKHFEGLWPSYVRGSLYIHLSLCLLFILHTEETALFNGKVWRSEIVGPSAAI